MKTYTHEEWLDEAERRFGDDPRDWLFVCPRCKTEQCAWDFYEAGVKGSTIDKVLAFSCIGRFTDGKGCDWTLGGLFQIHEVEVEFGDKKRRTFAFAEPRNHGVAMMEDIL